MPIWPGLWFRPMRFDAATEANGSQQPPTLTKQQHFGIVAAFAWVIVTLTFSFSSAMVLESSLSYLGIGIQPPQASWGNIISSNIGSWSYRPWLVAVPALTLAVVTLGINFLGDGLNDALNPRSKRSI